MTRAPLVTSTDVALLKALARERSVVRASRRVGITRDRAVYRIARLTRAFGGPVVTSRRGGSAHGGTVLTLLGDRIAHGGYDSVELLNARPMVPLGTPNLLRGTYRRAPRPEVRIGRRLSLRVAFDAEDGAPVSVLLDPETILVARRRFPSSARNVLAGVVESLRRRTGDFDVLLGVRCSGTLFHVALTEEPVRELGLKSGAAVTLYVKATALRRVGARSAARRPR